VKIAEWAVLVLGAIWALMTNYTVINYYRHNTQPAIPATTFAMVQTLSVIGVLLAHYSSFHLFWLFPMSYVAGYLALRIRPLMRVVWLYGYVLLCISRLGIR
jgi:hypothetical protein